MPVHLYIDLFVDSFWSAIAFTSSLELNSFAMMSFGGYPLSVVIGLALVASMMGMAINWGIGRMLLDIVSVAVSDGKEDKFATFTAKARRYGIWFVLFAAWLGPFTGPIALMAGIVNIRMALFVGLTFAGRGAFYLYESLVMQGSAPEISFGSLISLALRAMQ